ncbi:hypothetical protein CEUSTIGMA_g12235.t1 [Chlamydomonas eustigma]|uniref:Aldehyde dehydrogenase domain-containing protein n=1 Tax=Chlamydomonas eustigma TaxID=1157962 RepID=A0A250XP02_9CHLO|nr:hypothetical protein CEUSTIGMA_g12235.t1 [Chlamydomonas eustigma]|eukprot:GAX84814.1 hypothetical protein CEUSTIGMA_g12235.t1 [Chlamydomonas eustigma]
MLPSFVGCLKNRRCDALLPFSRCYNQWATVVPNEISCENPANVMNLVNGAWNETSKKRKLPDPLTGLNFMSVPDTQISEAGSFISSLKAVPKSGVHNAFKNPERYVMLGDVSAKVATEMRKPEVADFFARLIQRVAPKSYPQALGELVVTRKFFENFGGDQVRFLARGFSNPGDHMGQTSNGLRWPYGPVCVITPFNFPLEIPALQLMGALFMGNKPLLHVDQKVSIVAEQLLRLLHHCGLPKPDIDFMVGPGLTMNEIIKKAEPRNTLFTGSQRVAEKLAADTNGKVFLEDAGFDWKVLGPDAREEDLPYVSWQCDQDAYACSGQKCSAQSILFAHHNWVKLGILENMKQLASKRNLSDLTVGPVLSWTTEAMLAHTHKLLTVPGAKLLFGGKALTNHTIPAVYGAIEPTAVFIPIKEMLKPEVFPLATTEVFGPFQVVTEYSDSEVPLVLDALERMTNHLTAAVVSNNINFIQHVLGNSVNGTTYCGIRARTTGAPQNHWFGPAGDPRGAGIGTPEAIRLVWSCHREVINDFGPIPSTAILKTT